VDELPDRLVLEPARHVDDDVATGEPSLAAAVDVRVRRPAESQVATDVNVPGPEVRVDVGVVPVRWIGHALERPEMDPARDR
jgi:hypothetical protein